MKSKLIALCVISTVVFAPILTSTAQAFYPTTTGGGYSSQAKR